MATDYSKKTNADLVEILKSRSLPHTGKKADLVARIQQDDEKNSGGAPAAPKTDAAEDVIDWDDDVPAVKPATEAGAKSIAAGGKGAVANPVAVPNQKLDTDPATSHELKVESAGAGAATGEAPSSATEVEQKPTVDYTKGLPTTDLEAELAKRKARAAKFGIVEDEETAVKEAEKQLERAKRFGTGGTDEASTNVGVRGLDEALPEKSRKRGPADQGQGGRGGKRRDQGRNRNRGNPGNQNRNAGGNKGGSGGGNNAQSSQPKSWSEKDVAAMEARKKRFTTAA
ncbi:uncharacterized protein N7498_009632 [Penicillium cinerascens]|uniref:SAP domain-containing protein n=1 Tax=Penicillium cinerascens TaxID=70096 RepID=A0A9W9J6S4_9EURO|nr:uncharacterized protein N7498_009632 [Penicillium cinerascens]KAJ5190647.1 hypothetical protein N7498_009632 [Penicillium cinerascens]